MLFKNKLPPVNRLSVTARCRRQLAHIGELEFIACCQQAAIESVQEVRTDHCTGVILPDSSQCHKMQIDIARIAYHAQHPGAAKITHALGHTYTNSGFSLMPGPGRVRHRNGRTCGSRLHLLVEVIAVNQPSCYHQHNSGDERKEGFIRHRL